MTIDSDQIYKALASPVRRQILAWLKEPEVNFPKHGLPFDHGVSAAQINIRAGLSQSTCSAHLAALHRAGLVTVTPIGPWRYFKRSEAVIRAFLDSLPLEI
jgi:DNA-binding transcriptional ArsR family regulator